jgi:UDP-2,4-diacetamido-2,4,6-trideoxy-beta-L-gulopyranose hydrolase
MNQQWKNALINPKTSIVETLKVLDRVALRIALIVDTDDKLLGVVTDGDIRRALLNNTPLTEVVSNIMNKNPLTVSVINSNENAKKLMSKFGVLSIPVVDDGKIVGLECIQYPTEAEYLDNPVFIMAGGFGTRLKPLTDNCPKPMLKVGDKPILETLVKQFSKAGFRNIYISTHYLPDVITEYFGNGSNWGVNINYVYEKNPLGTGGALGLLPENVEALPLIMINGDVLTNINFKRLLDFHNKSNGCATMCVREYRHQIPYGVIEGENNRIVSMIEKPTQSFFINAGVYVLEPEIFKSVKKDAHIDMPSLLQQHIECDKDVHMFPIHEYWLDIGRMDDYHKAQTDVWSLNIL